jgi:hypothetical protein
MITKGAQRSKKIPTIFTVGHSTRPIAEFLSLLQQVGVDLLVDVRSMPRSRTNPQFDDIGCPPGNEFPNIPIKGSTYTVRGFVRPTLGMSGRLGCCLRRL